MSNTLKLGNGKWATGKDTLLSFSDTNNNYKPLPFSFSRASSGTVVNKAGLIETVGSGEPRIDFKDNTKGSLLLEPQRSNLQVYSEQFDNAAWTKTNLTVNTNQTISPNGELTADLLTTTSTVGSYVLDVAFVTSSQKYNYSVFVKKSNVNFFGFIIVDGVNVVRQYYDINNGVVGSSVNTGTPIVENIKIENYGNGWYRCSLTIQALNSAVEFRSYVVESDGTSTAPIGSKIFLWGAQVEQGSYATSYIPTNGSAVTRVEDACNNGANEQVINSTEGVFYAEVSALANDGTNRVISLSNGASSQRVILFYSSTNNKIEAIVFNGGFVQSAFSTTNYNVLLNNKLAISYKQNQFKFFVNGLQIGVTDTNGLTPTGLNQLAFNEGGVPNPFYGNVKDVRVYNTALTDQELIALTS